MKTRNNYGFLFDLDGVIIDSERKYTEIWTHIDTLFPTGKENMALAIKGMTLENILDTYYPDPATRHAVENKLWELESKMVYECCEGVGEFLRQVRDGGYSTALVTSSNALKLKHLWEQMPWLENCFDVIIDGDMVVNGKPSPECYLKAISKLNVLPSDCIVFEDSLQGVKAGNNAGCAVVGVSGTVDVDKLIEYADTIIDSFIAKTPDAFVELIVNKNDDRHAN